MSLESQLAALIDAIGADIKNKVETTDSRLSNSREWNAATVPRAEAEAGTAATRRAWTAERVRQAIAAWWDSITSAFGRSFVAAADAAAGRTALGLGTAATADVATSQYDTTLGRVLRVGDFGLGRDSRVQTAGGAAGWYKVAALSGYALTYHGFFLRVFCNTVRGSGAGSYIIECSGDSRGTTWVNYWGRAYRLGGLSPESTVVRFCWNTDGSVSVWVNLPAYSGFSATFMLNESVPGYGLLDTPMNELSTTAPVGTQATFESAPLPIYSDSLIYAQNLSGAAVAANATVSGASIAPGYTGTWRNVTNTSVANNNFGLWMRVWT